MKRLLLLTTLATTPALALDVNLAALLANRDTMTEAALAACALGVTDPAAADTALAAAGWSKSEGDGEGVWEYYAPDTLIVMWADPGFCMVDVEGLPTAAMADILQTLGQNALPMATDDQGCDTFDMGGGVTATLNGPGNDPACASDDGAAVRFQLPN